jgi:glutamine synthetase adenylyltransferase
MKKLMLAMVVLGFLSVSFTSPVNYADYKLVDDYRFNSEKYKDCMEACNESLSSCKKIEKSCMRDKGTKMQRCLQLCRESIAICAAASELMKLNSDSAKNVCAECTKICDKCARECDKFGTNEFKNCAKNCRKTAKLCNEI